MQGVVEAQGAGIRRSYSLSCPAGPGAPFIVRPGQPPSAMIHEAQRRLRERRFIGIREHILTDFSRPPSRAAVVRRYSAVHRAHAFCQSHHAAACNAAVARPLCMYPRCLRSRACAKKGCRSVVTLNHLDYHLACAWWQSGLPGRQVMHSTQCPADLGECQAQHTGGTPCRQCRGRRRLLMPPASLLLAAAAAHGGAGA